jgi:Flp pilus assembly protein protease CpaA
MVLQFLALAVCLIWGAAVILRDLTTFKISNRSISWGVVLLWPAFYLLNLRVQLNLFLLLLCALVLLSGLTSLIGMGDVKLMLLLAPWINQEKITSSIALLIAFSWLQLIAITLKQRRFPKRIAFAPAILFAAALNMAT